MFKGIEKFEKCLLADSAHIPPGSKGAHVCVIQGALELLDGYRVNSSEQRAMLYGATTRAGVLAYKRRRKIINPSYQTAADDIVGKMTIRSFDDEMLRWETTSAPPTPPAVSSKFPHPPSHKMPSSDAVAPRPVLSGTKRATLGVDATQATKAKTASPLTIKESPGGANDFVAPVTSFPQGLQDLIRRSNALKVPSKGDVIGSAHLYPFIARHEGPLPLRELSMRFSEPANINAQSALKDVYTRLEKYGLAGHLKTLFNTHNAEGSGSRGCFFHVNDQNKLFVQMELLANVSPVQIYSVPPYFCRDLFNVHGERDSWREVITGIGSAMHLCIPVVSKRADLGEDGRTDIHLDDYGQSQICVGGKCVPAPGTGTALHLWSVREYLGRCTVEEARKFVLWMGEHYYFRY